MNRYKDVKSFFSYWLRDIKFDEKLFKELQNFRLSWATKTDEYVEFLGSNLLGVHNIVFSSLDDDALLSIFKISDLKELQEDFYKVEGINKKFKIASNVIYHMLIYTAHRFITNSKLKKNVQYGGAREACLIMQYRMFSSFYYHYFKYLVDPNIAQTVYEKLSHKYLIKQLGSWQEVFDYRVKKCLEKSSPFYKRLVRLTTEDAVRIIIDIQTKLRSNVISIYKILVEVVNNKEAMNTVDATFTGGENNEKQVRDVDSLNKYVNIMKQITYSPNDFIDHDLVTVVVSLFPNIKEDLITKFLVCMTEERINKPKNYYPLLEKMIYINLEYLQRWNVNISDRSTIPKALVMVRNYWSSSKVKNKDMDEIKNYLRRMAKVCTGKRTSWLVNSLSIAFVTYVFLRMLKND